VRSFNLSTMTVAVTDLQHLPSVSIITNLDHRGYQIGTDSWVVKLNLVLRIGCGVEECASLCRGVGRGDNKFRS